jgi:hypothetical protein
MHQFTSEPRRCELAATQIARITSTRDADALRQDTERDRGHADDDRRIRAAPIMARSSSISELHRA